MIRFAAFATLKARIDADVRPSEDNLGVTLERTIDQLRRSISQLRGAKFVNTFLEDLKVSGVTSSNTNLSRCIILGLGSPSNSIDARLQLSFAIILLEHFGLNFSAMELYDPVFTPVDKELVGSLHKIFGSIVDHPNQPNKSYNTSNCSSENSTLLTREECDKYAGPDAQPTKDPTFWFMPHCEAVLYENVLKANWVNPGVLRSHIFLGNNFQSYTERWAQRKTSKGCPLHILSAANILRVCVKIKADGKTAPRELAAFGDTSVQIIGGVGDVSLPAVESNRCEDLE